MPPTKWYLTKFGPSPAARRPYVRFQKTAPPKAQEIHSSKTGFPKQGVKSGLRRARGE